MASSTPVAQMTVLVDEQEPTRFKCKKICIVTICSIKLILVIVGIVAVIVHFWPSLDDWIFLLGLLFMIAIVEAIGCFGAFTESLLCSRIYLVFSILGAIITILGMSLLLAPLQCSWTALIYVYTRDLQMLTKCR